MPLVSFFFLSVYGIFCKNYTIVAGLETVIEILGLFGKIVDTGYRITTRASGNSAFYQSLFLFSTITISQNRKIRKLISA